MGELIFSPHKCPRCKKTFEAPGNPVPGMIMYCKSCTELVRKLNQMEKQLLVDEFSLEQEDEKIVRQINNQLTKEVGFILKSEHDVTSALVERLIKDEKKRRKILKQILKLQREMIQGKRSIF